MLVNRFHPTIGKVLLTLGVTADGKVAMVQSLMVMRR